MKKLLLNVLVWAIAFAIAAYFVPWVTSDSLWTSIVAWIVLEKLSYQLHHSME
jgi:uncharacterized membrane protein YvlD (DUF360 family)